METLLGPVASTSPPPPTDHLSHLSSEPTCDPSVLLVHKMRPITCLWSSARWRQTRCPALERSTQLFVAPCPLATSLARAPSPTTSPPHGNTTRHAELLSFRQLLMSRVRPWERWRRLDSRPCGSRPLRPLRPSSSLPSTST